MELRVDLLFGNPVGVMSVITVLVIVFIIVTLAVMLIRNSGKGWRKADSAITIGLAGISVASVLFTG